MLRLLHSSCKMGSRYLSVIHSVTSFVDDRWSFNKNLINPSCKCSSLLRRSPWIVATRCQGGCECRQSQSRGQLVAPRLCRHTKPGHSECLCLHRDNCSGTRWCHGQLGKTIGKFEKTSRTIQMPTCKIRQIITGEHFKLILTSVLPRCVYSNQNLYLIT